MASNKDSEVKLPRATRVKNKAPASVQITAEQILREARDSEIRPPKQKIADATEAGDYRLRKRKEFENLVRRNTGAWAKYAQWEESQKDLDRARSVWERALKVDYKIHTTWLKYAEMEMRNRFVNRARNVWDRAVTLLPRVDQLWYKYIHMEEVLGNVAGARQVFERWMDWSPDRQGWLSYVNFELRYNETDRARSVLERFASEFEETECTRAIFKLALDCVPKGRAEEIYRYFFGNRDEIEDDIVGKRRFQYEDEVRKNPMGYDAWFDYVRLEESIGDRQKIREVYERAIANVPPAEEKRYWQRYIYLWINYALYEEIEARDVERTRDVYRECLNLIPHKKFSFAKIWLLAARFEIRQLNLKGARMILGRAIGKAPKDKIFKKYIEMELQMGNIDRCRKLYDKYLEWAPENCYAWIKYAEMEKSLYETERARAIFELAIDQPVLDMPELLWKTYIDFEISEGELGKARELYERLLDRTNDLKVWISYAKFEATAMEHVNNGGDSAEDEEEQKKECVERTRRLFEKAVNYFRTSAPELKEERAMLLNEWLYTEASFGDLGDINAVQSKLPKKLKKRRQIVREDDPARFEEFTDYLFPEETQTSNLKILEAAYKWKKQKISTDKD